MRVLEQAGFRIRGIAGTSAGGLWGSLYAFGYNPDEIQRRFSQIDPVTIYARQPGDAPAWMGLKGVKQLLYEALGDCRFEDLRMPFAVTAVDLHTAEFYTLQSGKVVDAIMATIALPGVFPSAQWNERTLIDGGVLSPVPVGLARSLAPQLPVVAVVLSPPVDEWSGMQEPRLLHSMPFVSQYMSRLRIAQALNIFMRGVDIGGAMLTELSLQLEQPDVIIRPAVPHIGLLDLVDVAEVARLGERATELALPQLEQAVGWRRRLVRRLKPYSVRRIRLPYAADFRS
jgi:NTE family protein